MDAYILENVEKIMKKTKKILAIVLSAMIFSGCSSVNRDNNKNITDSGVGSEKLDIADKGTAKKLTLYRKAEAPYDYGKLYDARSIDDKIYIAGTDYGEAVINSGAGVIFADVKNGTEKSFSVCDMNEEAEFRTYCQKTTENNRYCSGITNEDTFLLKVYNFSEEKLSVIWELENSGELKEYFFDGDDRAFFIFRTMDEDVLYIFNIKNASYESVALDTMRAYYKLCSDDDGNIYIFSSDLEEDSHKLQKYAPDTKKIYDKDIGDMNGCPFGIHIDPKSGELIATTQCDEDMMIYINTFDPVSGDTTGRYERDNDINSFYSGNDEYRLFASASDDYNTTVYGYDYITNELSELYTVNTAENRIVSDVLENGTVIIEEFEDVSVDVYEGMRIFDSEKNPISSKEFIKNHDGYISRAYIGEKAELYYIEEGYNPVHISENDMGIAFHTIHCIDEKNQHISFQISVIDEFYYPLFITADSEKNIYIGEQHEDGLVIRVFDINGELVSEMTKQAFISLNTYIMYDNKLHIFCEESGDVQNEYIINIEDSSLEKTDTHEGISYGCASPNGMYFIANAGINEYCYSDGAVKKLLVYAESGLSGGFDMIRSIGNEEFIAFDSNALNSEYCILEKYETDSAVQTISVGGVCMDSVIGEQIIEFNDEHDDIKITYTEYSSREKSLEQMNLDLLGNKLDVIVSGISFSVDNYSTDIFVDLSDFLYSDPDIDVSEYYENCIELFKRNGRLYKIFPSFTISALAVRGDALNGNKKTGWNENEFLEFINRNGLFSEIDYSGFVERIAPAIVRSCCDYTNYSCDFTGSGFKNIIKAVSENSQNNDFGNSGSILDGTSSVNEVNIDKDFTNLIKYDDDDIVFKGYPAEQGNGVIVSPEFSFSISANCANKQAAWEFIKSFIQDDYQSAITDPEEYMVWGIPLKKSCAEKGFTRESFSLASDDMQRISDTLKERITELITCADCPNNLAENSRELKIIKEETERFFASEIDENSMASTVQNKVSLFYNEIR